LLTAGRPLARSAAFDSAAPTNPTGRPITSAGATPWAMISSSAVGALPTTHTAPGPALAYDSRIPAAERVRPSGLSSTSPIEQITGRAVIPAATIATSVTIGAPSRSARSPCRRRSSSVTRSVA
jgi:hypothetical protein